MSVAFAPLMYYFPGSRQVPAEFAARMEQRYGCPYAAIPRCTSADSAGPISGVRGCLAGFGSDLPVQYMERTYRWDRIDNGWWIGAWKHATPSQFQRVRDFVPGVAVELGDGNAWCIPVANPFLPSCTLPSHDALIAGAWRTVPKDAYSHLSELAIDIAGHYRDAFLNGKPFAMDDADLRQFVADTIAINYNLDLQECSALRLFAPAIWRRVVETFIDWVGYLQILAAELQGAGTDAGPDPTPDCPATSATAPGGPDSAPSIAPPLPTSI